VKSRRYIRFRYRRYVAVLACAASMLAVPALASARPMPADQPTSAIGASFAPSERVTNSLPAFHPSASERVTDYQAPASFSQPTSTVTIVKHSYDGRTLAIALSGAALLVALLGSGYVLVRMHGIRQTPAGGIS
jgi:hypothetical protein